MAMLLDEIYDSNGQDGLDNKEAFEILPKQYQYFFTSMQKALCQRIEKEVTRKFGIVGLGSLKKTSGFRSYRTNARHNGKSDSLHLVGAAADFSKYGIFAVDSIPVPSCLQCIDSGDCWHIQYKRGV